MDIEDLLMNIIKLSDIDLGCEEQTRESLRHKIENDSIDFIRNDEGKLIGFYTWRVYKKFNCSNILLNNFVVLKKYRKEINLIKLRKRMLERFPNANSFYWDNLKRGKRKEVFLSK